MSCSRCRRGVGELKDAVRQTNPNCVFESDEKLYASVHQSHLAHEAWIRQNNENFKKYRTILGPDHPDFEESKKWSKNH